MTRRRWWLLSSPLLIPLFISCDERRLTALSADEPMLAEGGVGGITTPSSLTATAVSPGRVDLAWNDNSTNEAGFEVHRSTTGPSGAFTMWTSTQAGVTNFSDAAVNHSTQYCYKLRAFRITGRKTSYSEFSTGACATTPAPPPPAAPSQADAWPYNSSEATVTWIDNSTNEDGFRVERSLDGGTSWNTAGVAEWGLFSDPGRTSEQLVCYRVTAFSTAGESPASNPACTTPPAGPSNLTATVIDGQTVELAWTDNSGVEDGFYVWSDYGELSTFLEPNTTTLRLEGWEGWLALTYTVEARKDGGRSDSSNPATPTPRPETGTNASATSSPNLAKPR